MPLDLFSTLRQQQGAPTTATPTTDKLLGPTATAGRPTTAGATTKKLLGEEGAWQDRLAKAQQGDFYKKYGGKQEPLVKDLAHSFFVDGIKGLIRGGVSIGKGIVDLNSKLGEAADYTGQYLGSKLAGKEFTYKKTNATKFNETVSKTIPEFSMNPRELNVYHNELLAQQLEEEGKTEEANQVRETGKILKIEAMSDREVVDQLDEPGLVRQVTRAIAATAPTFAAASGVGSAAVPLTKGASLLTKVGQVGARGGVTGLSAGFLDRDVTKDAKDQTKEMLIDAAIFAGTDVALLGAGIGAKALYGKAKAGVKNLVYKMRSGQPLSKVEEDVVLNSIQTKRMLGEPLKEPVDVQKLAQQFGGEDNIPLNQIDAEEFARVSALEDLKGLSKVTDDLKQPFYKKITGGVVNAAKIFHENAISKYQFLNDVEKAVYKQGGVIRPYLKLSEKFEQVAGAQGKAEADLLKFQRDVVDPVKGLWDEFQQYVMAKRIIDRLETDSTTRAVGTWTTEKATKALDQLRKEVGEDSWAAIEIASNRYQQYMDQALRLQVDSGRLSQAAYDTIKENNKFYAPFKVLRNVEDMEGALRSEGVGRNISTTQELTKGIKGIADDDFLLDDILEGSAQQIYKSRILAEKNLKMQELYKLSQGVDAATGPDQLMSKVAASQYMRELVGDAKPPRGWGRVHIFVNGEDKVLAVAPRLLQAVQGLDRNMTGFMVKALEMGSKPLKAGATALNIPFQVVNVGVRDPLRTLTYFNYAKSPADLARFPLDMARAFYHSMKGNFGSAESRTGDQVFMDFLNSGAAAGDIQTWLTPGAFKKVVRPPDTFIQKYAGTPIRKALNSVAAIGRTLEQTGKITGWMRGMREVNAKFRVPGTTISEEALKRNPKYAEAISELVTEVRNFSGSPDFARGGHISPDLNLLFMFLNARVQGTAADIGRLAGVRGRGTTAAWAAVGTMAAAAMANRIRNRIYYDDDTNALLDWENQNYAVVFGDKTFVNEDGQVVRDGFRFPKEGVYGALMNVAEKAVDFAFTQDRRAAVDAGLDIIEGLAPVNISGQNLLERGESFVSNLNPGIRLPFEVFSGRDFFRHRNIISQDKEDASGYLQYNDQTPSGYVKAGKLLHDIGAPDELSSPQRLEHAVNIATGGAAKQLEVNKPIEGRSFWSEFLGTKRFFRSPWTNEADVQKRLHESLTRQADDRIKVEEKAEKLYTELKGQPASQIQKRLKDEDTKVVRKVLDIADEEKKGLTFTDRQVMRLGVKNGERARFLLDEVKKIEKGKRAAFLEEMQKKGILTPEVLRQVNYLRSQE